MIIENGMAHAALPQDEQELPRDKQERLRSALLKALTNQVATCSKLKATTKKLESIKRKQRSLQATAVTTKQSIDTALDDYAKVLCRCFCEDVYRRFPREVRDMIYGYMYPIDSFPVTAAFFTADHPRLDHWRFADFVGSDMHQELGEHFFRSTYFTFGPTMTCLDLVPKFRMVDEAKLGYVPAYFVAHVQIDINCDNLRASRWTNPDEWDTHKKTRKFDSDILSNLELLFGFQQGTKLLLRFRKSSDDSDSWSASYLDDLDWLCENIAPLISPTVQRYNVAGYGVVVAFASGFDQAGEYSFIPDPVPSSALAWKAEFARYKETRKREEAAAWAAIEAANDGVDAEEVYLSYDDEEEDEEDEQDENED